MTKGIRKGIILAGGAGSRLSSHGPAMYIRGLARQVQMPAEAASRRRYRDYGRRRVLHFLLIELRVSAAENCHA